MSTPFVLNVLLLAQQTQLGAGSLYFFKLFYCQRRQSGLKSGGHESGHRKIFQIKKFLAKNSNEFLSLTLKMFVAPRNSKNYHLQLHSGLIILFFLKKTTFKHTFCAKQVCCPLKITTAGPEV